VAILLAIIATGILGIIPSWLRGRSEPGRPAMVLTAGHLVFQNGAGHCDRHSQELQDPYEGAVLHAAGVTLSGRAARHRHRRLRAHRGLFMCIRFTKNGQAMLASPRTEGAALNISVDRPGHRHVRRLLAGIAGALVGPLQPPPTMGGNV
jgi:hypothetical protein